HGPWMTNGVAGYFASSPPTPASAADIRAVAKKSANATPWMQPARRWELAGWKNAVAPGTNSLNAWFNAAFTGSAALFNGWEGARGPYDCEPLMRQFRAATQTYVNKAMYWIEHYPPPPGGGPLRAAPRPGVSIARWRSRRSSSPCARAWRSR